MAFASFWHAAWEGISTRGAFCHIFKIFENLDFRNKTIQLLKNSVLFFIQKLIDTILSIFFKISIFAIRIPVPNRPSIFITWSLLNKFLVNKNIQLWKYSTFKVFLTY